MQAIRERRAAAAGRPAAKEFDRVLAERDPDDAPPPARPAGRGRRHPLDSFETRITTVLAGIAARRGEDWSAIAPKVDRLLTAHG